MQMMMSWGSCLALISSIVSVWINGWRSMHPAPYANVKLVRILGVHLHQARPINDKILWVKTSYRNLMCQKDESSFFSSWNNPFNRSFVWPKWIWFVQLRLCLFLNRALYDKQKTSIPPIWIELPDNITCQIRVWSHFSISKLDYHRTDPLFLFYYHVKVEREQTGKPWISSILLLIVLLPCVFSLPELRTGFLR